jgi:hypothetical protein
VARPPAPTRGRDPVEPGKAWRFVAAPFLLGAAGMSSASPALEEGNWGGEQVVLMVGADKAVLRLGCAEGEFPVPVRLDDHGKFSNSGLYTPYSGGPSPAGGERAVTAEYQGKVDGSRLTLTVRHGASTDTYQLTRGVRSKVIRCL